MNKTKHENIEKFGKVITISTLTLVIILLIASLADIYINDRINNYIKSRRYCVVYGFVTDLFLNQSVKNATIMFFVGEPKEIPYTNASYYINTDAKGFYIYILPLYQGHEYPEILAVADGYFSTPMYLESRHPKDIMEYGYIEPMLYQFTLYQADFQIAQLGNFSIRR